MSRVEIIIAIIFLTGILSLFGWLCVDVIESNKEYKIEGVVVDVFRTDAGYKVSAKPHVVIYCDSLKRNVDIVTTWQTYVNAYKGKKVTFYLRKMDLND